MTELLGITAALTSAASWALASVLFKGLSEDWDSLSLTYAKSVICSLILLFLVLIFKIPVPPEKDILMLFGSGIIGILLGDSFFFAALKRLTPQALTVLLMCGQVITAIMALVFLGEHVVFQVWLGLGLVLFGLYCILLPEKNNGENNENGAGKTKFKGLIFGVISIVCMALSMIISKQALENNSTLWATLIRMSSAVFGMFTMGIIMRRISHWNGLFILRKYRLRFYFSALIITFGGFWLSMVAVKYVQVAVASTLMATEPIFALPFFAIIEKKKIHKSEVIGVLMAVVGLIMVILYNK